MRLSEPVFLVDGLWRCSFFGEFLTLSGFHEENLQLEFTIQLPDRWFHRNLHPPASAISQKCFVNDQSVAHIGLPFSFHFLVTDERRDKNEKPVPVDKTTEPKGDDRDSSPPATEKTEFPLMDKEPVAGGISWPRVCVRVFGIDGFGRRTMVGMGSTCMPQSAGHHMLSIPTCRTVSDSHGDRLSELFLGFVEDGEDDVDRDIVHPPDSRTETSGTVTVRVQCILRSEASVEQRKRERELLSASIEEVVAAFERAKLEMMELRQQVIREQKDYEKKMMVQRTFL